MTDSNTRDYYRRRAERQATLAEAATISGVRTIHREMVDRYRALAEAADDAGSRPMLKLVL